VANPSDAEMGGKRAFSNRRRVEGRQALMMDRTAMLIGEKKPVKHLPTGARSQRPGSGGRDRPLNFIKLQITSAQIRASPELRAGIILEKGAGFVDR
jgi:hypothetical protein